MKTLGNILQLSSDYLKKHHVPKPRVTAEYLLAHFLKLKRIELYMHFEKPLEEKELKPFRQALKRKIAGEPLEYILEEIEFFHCQIRLTQDVLIPRQETEILLDRAIKSLDGSEKKALDLCTGSGCLAIGLKKAHPEIEVVGLDLSEKALQVALSNAKLNAVSVEWIQGDLIDPLKGKKFDLVLCNPPYVSKQQYQRLEKEVRGFEPELALTPGKSGYEIFDRLANTLPYVLNPGAKVFFEIGANQKEGVLSRFSASYWSQAVVEKDWAGLDRFFHSIFLENP